MLVIDEKKAAIWINIFSILLGALLACLGIFCYEGLIKFICVFMGIILIVINIYPSIYYTTLATQDKKYWIEATASIIFVVLGFLFIFEHGMAVSIILGVFCILLPILRICFAPDKKNQAKKEIPLFIIAALMLFNVWDTVFRFAIIICAVLLVILGIVNLILSSSFMAKKMNKDPNVIDVKIKEE